MSRKRQGIGLDFGTSNSAAAWFDGEHLHTVSLGGRSPVLPTAIHLDRSYLALTGQAAIDQYISENRGRRVELVAEVIGGRPVPSLATTPGKIFPGSKHDAM